MAEITIMFAVEVSIDHPLYDDYSGHPEDHDVPEEDSEAIDDLHESIASMVESTVQQIVDFGTEDTEDGAGSFEVTAVVTDSIN